MWTLTVTVSLLLGPVCLAAGDGRPYFVSRDFTNVLHWEAVKPNAPDETVLYSVFYRSDQGNGQNQMKAECQDITSLSCDLTAETPSIYDVHYWAKVSANGRTLNSTLRFKPIAETVLGPAILSISTTATKLNISVTLPMRPDGTSILDIIERTRPLKINPPVVYILIITHPEWAVQSSESTTGQFTINRRKNHRTQYGGHVVYKPAMEMGRPMSEPAHFQVTPPGDSVAVIYWCVVALACVALSITVSAVFACRYVRSGKEEHMPQSLTNSHSNQQPQLLQPADQSLAISRLKVADPLPACQKVFHVDGYASQDIPDESMGSIPSSGSPAPRLAGHQDTSDQSTIYSSALVHVPDEKVDPFKLSGEADGVDLTGVHSGTPPSEDGLGCQGGSSSRGLFLPTIRDAEGKITLSMLSNESVPQSSVGDSRLAGSCERQLRLSDLIEGDGDGPPPMSLLVIEDSDCSDSGCEPNTLDTPTMEFFGCHGYLSQPLLPAAPPPNPETEAIQAERDAVRSAYAQSWIPSLWSSKGQELPV